MRTLYLLRHAKSTRPDDNTEDHDRDLTPRGRRSCVQIGRWLSHTAELPAPELVLGSTARRVIETIEGLLPQFERRPLVQTDRELYLASAGHILKAIQRVEDRYTTLLVVGHNPGMHTLALRLAGGGDREAAEELARKFPTAALAALRFSARSWREVEADGGDLLHFVSPRSLQA